MKFLLPFFDFEEDEELPEDYKTWKLIMFTKELGDFVGIDMNTLNLLFSRHKRGDFADIDNDDDIQIIQ